jgi:hypothetical protein
VEDDMHPFSRAYLRAGQLGFLEGYLNLLSRAH